MYDVMRFKGNKPDVIIVASWELVPLNRRRWAFQFTGGKCVYPRVLKGIRFGHLVNHEQSLYNVKGRILANAFAMEERGYLILELTGHKHIANGNEVTMQCFKGRPNGRRFPDNPESALSSSSLSPSILQTASHVARTKSQPASHVARANPGSPSLHVAETISESASHVAQTKVSCHPPCHVTRAPMSPIRVPSLHVALPTMYPLPTMSPCHEAG